MSFRFPLIATAVLALATLSLPAAAAPARPACPPPASTSPSTTVSAVWSRSDQGFQAMGPTQGITAHARGYSLSLVHRTASGWRFGARFGSGEYRLLQPGVMNPQPWVSQPNNMKYVAAGAGRRFDLGQGVSLLARAAFALSVQSGQGHGGASYFGRGGAVVLRIPYSAMGAVHLGVSKAPWQIANNQGLLDQAPTDWHAGVSYGQVSLRLDRLVGDGGGYNHVALAWQTRWVRIEVGRSTASTRVVSGLAAVQTIVTPFSPWKAYQGGSYMLVRVQLTQGIAVRALYWRGQPPVAGEYGGHSAGGSQAALGVSMTF